MLGMIQNSARVASSQACRGEKPAWFCTSRPMSAGAMTAPLTAMVVGGVAARMVLIRMA
ncbi:MAG TPA: hypothetical protein VFQ87_03980 [Bradyrhizobium sp.]|nr:hypothetical protein [Bradyrhizobium sp.]